MKILIEKEFEVELQNGFYWSAKRREGYYVRDKNILRLVVADAYLSIENVCDEWIKAQATAIYNEIEDENLLRKHEQLEIIAEKSAQLFGAI